MRENPFTLVDPDQLSFLEVTPDEYAQAMAYDVVRFYDDMGLDPNFMPIVAKHLGDIHLQWDVLGNTPTALGVAYSMQDGNTRKWYRTANINRSHFELYRDVVHDTLEDRGMIKDKDEDHVAEKLALNWMFYGLTADAVANSYSMQQRYNAYIPDWNGQAPIFLAQYAMSEAFYSEYAPGTEHDARTMSLDHENFRAGVSLLQLKDDLLRMGVVTHDTVAGWVTHDFAENYPILRGMSRQSLQPHSREEVMQRLNFLTPRRDVKERMAAFILSLGKIDESLFPIVDLLY